MGRVRQLRVATVVVVLASAAVTASCGDDQAQAEVTSRLDISVVADDGAKPDRATLECPGQTPRARDACAALDVVAPRIFEPVPVDQACTMIYGGPQHATITGTFDDEKVDAEFNQSNGCEIARWNQVAPTLKALGLT